jgi:Protein of unknown function, DUF547
MRPDGYGPDVHEQPLLSRRSVVLWAAAAAACSLAPAVLNPALAADLGQFSAEDPASAVVVDHSPWGALLGKYLAKPVADGPHTVNYAEFKAKDRATLAGYIKTLGAVDVAKLRRAEQLALWFNLYNAVTVAAVLDAYPVKSIKDISLGGSLKANLTGGPWDAPLVKVSGVELSLNDIEHRIVRPLARDPRIHYAVNCASIGCPTLVATPFTGARLDAQLDALAKTYINSPNGVRVAKKAVTLSSIYDWYKDDFGDAKGLRGHLLKYADAERAKAITGAKRFSYSYDWALNDRPQGA